MPELRPQRTVQPRWPAPPFRTPSLGGGCLQREGEREKGQREKGRDVEGGREVREQINDVISIVVIVECHWLCGYRFDDDEMQFAK